MKKNNNNKIKKKMLELTRPIYFVIKFITYILNKYIKYTVNYHDLNMLNKRRKIKNLKSQSFALK